MEGSMREVTERLSERLTYMPELPGVYKMLDENGTIIYIGKSICLKKRVKSYFSEHPNWDKVNKMMPFIKDIEYIVTDTHLEAMLLECELIKNIKPYFNAQMKNDERYVYLKVIQKRSSKPLAIVNQVEQDSFGPFRSRGTLRELLELLNYIYPIKIEGRKYSFEYHIFPICLDETLFEENKRSLLKLCNQPKSIVYFLKEAEKKMLDAAKDKRFETASKYQDLIRKFGYLRYRLEKYQQWMKKTILLQIELQQGYKLFLIYKGYIIHKDVVSQVTAENKDNFVKIGNDKKKHVSIDLGSKAMIDYRDIVFKELSNLSADNYELL